MEMQERIDTLIKMRKEKPEHHWEWNKLRNALVQEDGILTSEQQAHLNTAFRTIQQEEQLKLWDDHFHEVLITGTFTNEYSIAMDNSATSRVTLGGNIGTSTWSTNTATASNIASTMAKKALTNEMANAYYERSHTNEDNRS